MYQYLKQIEAIVGFPVTLWRKFPDGALHPDGTQKSSWQAVNVVSGSGANGAVVGYMRSNVEHDGRFYIWKQGEPLPADLVNGYVTPDNYPGFVMQFGLTMLPGCCAYAVSTGTRVSDKYQKRGLNKIGIQLREYILKQSGFSGWICTDILSNAASLKTLEFNGFKKLYTLKNHRTERQVGLFLKHFFPEDNPNQ